MLASAVVRTFNGWPLAAVPAQEVRPETTLESREYAICVSLASAGVRSLFTLAFGGQTGIATRRPATGHPVGAAPASHIVRSTTGIRNRLVTPRVPIVHRTSLVVVVERVLLLSGSTWWICRLDWYERSGFSPSAAVTLSNVLLPSQLRHALKLTAARPNELIFLSAQTFAELGVPAELLTVLARRTSPRPRRSRRPRWLIRSAGRDVLGRGRTGSGKTYAFLLPW